MAINAGKKFENDFKNSVNTDEDRKKYFCTDSRMEQQEL